MQINRNPQEIQRNPLEINENQKKCIGSGYKSIRKPMELYANPKKSIGSGHKSIENQFGIGCNSTEIQRNPYEIKSKSLNMMTNFR